MNIYIKNTDGNIELLATKELVGRLNTQSNKPIVGMCITKEGIGTHCLFKNENGEMRIYLYETSTKTFLNVYYKLNADGNFDTTSNQSVSPPAGGLSASHLFSDEEIATLYQQEQSGVVSKEKIPCPYLEGSKLSPEQQEKLYFSVVTSTSQGASFYDYLQENILSLTNPGPERILKSSIGEKGIMLTDKEKRERNVFRFEFFAPNMIVRFSQLLLHPNESNYMPTVGDILDYYQYCVQQTLKNLGASSVISPQCYSPETRAAKLGETKIDFKETSIYSPLCLLMVDDAIDPLADALTALNSANILTQDNRNAIKNHRDPRSLARTLKTLTSANILDQNNFDAIKNHRDPRSLADALTALNSANILTQDNRNAIGRHRNPQPLACALQALNSVNILDQNNFDAIKKNNRDYDPWSLARTLKMLTSENILDQNNFDAVKNHHDLWSLAGALETLTFANILDQNNFDAIKDHCDPRSLADALTALNSANILTQDNRNAIKNHRDPRSLADALETLTSKNILDQNSFNAIIINKNSPTAFSRALHDSSKTRKRNNTSSFFSEPKHTSAVPAEQLNHAL